MAKFRKKPVVIEAVQWDGTIEGGNEIIDWAGNKVFWLKGWTSRLVIDTLEGTMEVGRKDWVIRGVAGEFYPCKPDIFEKTYEEI